jgi:putative ABC transport system substrate-binding protein
MMAVLAGCAQMRLTPTHVGTRSDDAPIVVIKSTANPIYDGPVQGFIMQLGATSDVYVVDASDHPDRLARQLKRLGPRFAFALGTRAALLAREALPEVPTCFAMVLNHRRVAPLKAPNVMGIAFELPSNAEFARFKMVLPEVHRIVAFYVASESAPLVDEAKVSLAELGITLDAVQVTNAAAVPAAYAERRGQFDAVWFMNDAQIMKPATFKFLKDSTIADKVPFVSSLSEEFAKAGALMSVSVDFTSLGAQAAAMTHDVLESGASVGSFGVQPPIGGRLVLNLTVARSLGLDVPDDVLPFINEVVVASATSR